MSSRAAGLNAETIQSLNLIEIDFHDKPKVVSAWKDYFQHLCLVGPADENQAQRFAEKRQRLNVALLDAIAKAVGYKIEQLSILEGGYYPNLAARTEADQHAIREMFAAIAQGRRALPISVVAVPQPEDGNRPSSAL